MPGRPIKTQTLTATGEHPILRVRRTWPDLVVVLGSSPTSAIKMAAPNNPVVPTYPSMGPLSQTKAAVTLARVAPYPADIYVVEVVTPAGKRTYGVVAVPRSLIPEFTIS